MKKLNEVQVLTIITPSEAQLAVIEANNVAANETFKAYKESQKVIRVAVIEAINSAKLAYELSQK